MSITEPITLSLGNLPQALLRSSCSNRPGIGHLQPPFAVRRTNPHYTPSLVQVTCCFWHSFLLVSLFVLGHVDHFPLFVCLCAYCRDTEGEAIYWLHSLLTSLIALPHYLSPPIIISQIFPLEKTFRGKKK